MKRGLTIGLFGAFVVLALYETSNALWASHRVASDGDWEAAAAEVRAGFKQGDLIVFAPAWVDQVGRQHLGDLMPVEMIARPDDSLYARAWEVSIRGAEHALPGARIASSNQHGRVRVRLLERGVVHRPNYDFVANLEEARVTQVAASGAETPCYKDGAAFRCASTRVERRTLEVDYAPRRGILVPVDGALTTRVEFPEWPGGRILGYTGLHDYYSRKSADGPVDFKVFVDGKELVALRHGNRDGWRRFDAADTDLGRAHPVRFEISAPSAAWRTFGFYAESDLIEVAN